MPASAQIGAGALRNRIQSIDPTTVSQADCDTNVDRAAALNGPDLLYAAAVCGAANRPVESTFLLNAGQTRSTVDMILMVPATRADSDLTVELYGFIYAYAGGPGDESIFRDATMQTRFLELFNNWSPAYSPEYNPGWSVRRRPEGSVYHAAIDEARDGRRQQLAEIAALYSDDTYYALHRRFQELQARNSSSYVEGTPEADLADDLTRQMSERAEALGIDAFGGAEGRGEFEEPRFPPAVPTSGEAIVAERDDPVVQRCADMAERLTIATDAAVRRVLVTRSQEWGIIWRGDIVGGDQPPTRFTCTATTSSSRPMDGPDETIPALPQSTSSGESQGTLLFPIN